MIEHPDYDPDYVDNDVALLKFSTDDSKAVFDESKKSSSGKKRGKKATSTYSPACLPEQDEEMPVGTECMIMGWGKKNEKDAFGNDILHEAKVLNLFFF